MTRGRGLARAALAASLIAVVGGCATGPLASFTSVTPLPTVMALQGQSPRDQEWDVKDCQAEAGYRTDYSPTDSPFANLVRRVFFWGTAGAAVGGTVDGFPTVVDASEASTGLIAGASAGGAVGAASSWAGQSRYEREWIACMLSRGYAIAPPGAEAPAAPPSPGPAPR
jgi:hypothetical protein